MSNTTFSMTTPSLSASSMSSSLPPTSIPPDSMPPTSTPPESSSTPPMTSSSIPITSMTPTSSAMPSSSRMSQNSTTFIRQTTTVVTSNRSGTTTKTIEVTRPSPDKETRTSTAGPTTSPASLVSSGNDSGDGSGLSEAGTVAIAVVIPVFVVALLIILGIFFYRKRKQKKYAEEARRKEIEDYGYNPNDDPTLPAVVGMGGSSHSPEMSEDVNGYRGWGNNTTVASTNRKASTNLSSGMVVSDDGRGRSPGSPGHPSDGDRSSDPLMQSMPNGSAGAGAATMGGAGVIPAGGVARGPSNASSTYSATGRTENSEDVGNLPDYDNNYSQYAPYASGNAPYSDSAQPIIRDVTARRNTKIENPAVYPQQGNSGIAQNF